MKEKILYRFDYSWQASAVSSKLRALGIPFRSIATPREYASILVGGMKDGVDLLVPEQDYVRARNVVDQFFRNVEAQTKIKSEVLEKNYFKRVIVFSVMGVIVVPLLFNAIATFNFLHMLKHPSSLVARVTAFAVLLTSWILAIYWIYQFTRPI